MDLAAFGRLDLLPRERGGGLVGAVGGVGLVGGGVWVSLVRLVSVASVVSWVWVLVVASPVRLWRSDPVGTSVRPDVGWPKAAGFGLSCCVAC